MKNIRVCLYLCAFQNRYFRTQLRTHRAGRTRSIAISLAPPPLQLERRKRLFIGFSASPPSPSKKLIKELSAWSGGGWREAGGEGRREGGRERFGDITEQHENLECVLNLCSQRRTHLRGRPALVHFQTAFWRHVAAK